jgi:hypothetical protein
MTATAAVQAEIERFLRSKDPEVLCITGDWGVGKTFNWQTTFDRLRTAKQVGLGRYSYVSLFGINSLEAFKQSLFENLEFVLPEGEAVFDRIRARGNQLFQQSKKAVGAVTAVPMVGDAITKLSSPFLFSSIRNQIICVDDLERRGKDLTSANYPSASPAPAASSARGVDTARAALLHPPHSRDRLFCLSGDAA